MQNHKFNWIFASCFKGFAGCPNRKIQKQYLSDCSSFICRAGSQAQITRVQAASCFKARQQQRQRTQKYLVDARSSMRAQKVSVRCLSLLAQPQRRFRASLSTNFGRQLNATAQIPKTWPAQWPRHRQITCTPSPLPVSQSVRQSVNRSSSKP